KILGEVGRAGRRCEQDEQAGQCQQTVFFHRLIFQFCSAKISRHGFSIKRPARSMTPAATVGCRGATEKLRPENKKTSDSYKTENEGASRMRLNTSRDT